MRCRYKLWGMLAAAFSIGILLGRILPPGFIIVLEGLLILFLTFCWLCS